MINLLFVCHGNICRSPMAEFVMKHLIHTHHLEARYHVESAGTSSEELGNPVYPPVKKLLSQKGIDCSGKIARQLSAADYAAFDVIIGLDSANMRNMMRCFGGDPEGKCTLLLDYTDHPGDVADPWYTRDFNATWTDVYAGCEGLLAHLEATESW
ncbi:MAG: low molecular weight protein-tyrosine phosphatase [Clostridiales bacterium]|nr:low molecular weight protein-tyrosine phosphatase [Clostridiales bacterium]